MKKAEIEMNIKSLEIELAQAVQICSVMGCLMDDGEFFEKRDSMSIEQCVAHTNLFCTISELNFQRRQLCKKNHVEFTNKMLCQKDLF